MYAAEDAAEIEREVVELHRVIEGWLAGRLSRSSQAFAAFADLLAEDFTVLPPDGTVVSRENVLYGFEGAHGALPGVAVEIRAFRFIDSGAEIGVARFEEWQQHVSNSNARASLVAMRRDPIARHGWRWLALHEAWLPGGAPGGED